MPTLGNALDFAKYEGRNLRAHILGAAPSSPVTGQLYYNSGDNTLYWWDGTAWQSAKGGSGSPTGAAGGDLSGTYPNPQIAAGVIVNADVAAGAAIALTKLATDPLARANHTGTQLAATISDFNTARDLQRLDQHVAPTAAVALGGQKITGLATPTVATDAATMGYVDAVAQGLDAKASVRAASTSTLALTGTPQTLDGISVTTGDRVLVKNQATASQNGIYVVGVGTWARATDMDASAEFVGAFVFVEEGTTQADTGWVCTTDTPFTMGTNAANWTQFSASGSIIDGAGLLKTGNTFDVQVDSSSIEINADILRVKALGITNAMLAGAIDLTTKVSGQLGLANGGTGQDATGTPGKIAARASLAAAGYYSSATHGASTTITITQATHNCRASRGLIVQVQDEATGAVEIPDIVVAATGDVTVTFGASVTANSKRVTVIG